MCTPQAFLPLNKWFQLVFCQKLHFWRACAARGALTLLSCQKMQEKNGKLLHCLGWSHGGIPAWRVVTQAERSQRLGLRFWDALQWLNQAAKTHQGLVFLGGCRNRSVAASVIYPGTYLPGYQHAAATLWHVCQSWSISNLYLNIPALAARPDNQKLICEWMELPAFIRGSHIADRHLNLWSTRSFFILIFLSL